MTEPTKDPADERLSRSVMDALWRSEPIRSLDLGSLQVVARGRTVVLRGLVATEAHKYAAARLANGVPGVGEVVNELVTDHDLERSVALALASDETTRHHRIVVRVVGGVASLYGAVPDAGTAERVRNVAIAVPGLVGVESKLQIVPPGTPVILSWQHSVEGRPLPTPQSPDAAEPGVAAQPEPEKPATSPTVAGMEGTA